MLLAILPLAMAALSSTYVVLTALLNGVFYVYMPSDVQSASVMFQTKNFSSNNCWIKMFYQTQNNVTPAFRVKAPLDAAEYMRYRIKYHFRNQTFGETDWRVLFTKNTTLPEKNILPEKNMNMTQIIVEDPAIGAIYNMVVCLSITCNVLLSNFVYTIVRPYFNKK
jgi:hypothetical protein